LIVWLIKDAGFMQHRTRSEDDKKWFMCKDLQESGPEVAATISL
jgi:hypothetical protein